MGNSDSKEKPSTLLLTPWQSVSMPNDLFGTHQKNQSTEDHHDRTALPYWAAGCEQIDTVKILSESIAPDGRLECPQAKDDQDMPPLHLAAGWRPSKAVKELLESLAHDEKLKYLEAKDTDGRTALHFASVRRNTDTLKVLLESIAHDERVKYLQSRDESGCTALHCAAQHERTDAVRALLESVAYDERLQLLKAKDKNGQTALYLAFTNADIIKYLIESVEQAQRLHLLFDNNNDQDNAPMLIAKHKDAEDICQVLRLLSLTQRFELMRVQGKDGQTVLHALSANRQKCDQSKLTTVVSLTGRFAQKLMKMEDSDRHTPADVAQTRNIKELLTHKLETYNLNKAPHVIIFYTTHERPGSVEEMITLSDVLSAIGLLPDICSDFNKDELLPKIDHACGQSDISGLIVFIMTHGGASSIRDQQRQRLDIQDILLALDGGDGIPKMLILQTCRAWVTVPQPNMAESSAHSEEPALRLPCISNSEITSNLPETNVAQNSTTATPGSITGSSDSKIGSKHSETFHQIAPDVLVVCASLHGCPAERNHFIPILAKHLLQSGLDENAINIVARTNREMQEHTDRHQVLELRSTLTRSFCIKDFAPDQ